jgi:hypothetical protein
MLLPLLTLMTSYLLSDLVGSCWSIDNAREANHGAFLLMEPYYRLWRNNITARSLGVDAFGIDRHVTPRQIFR